MDFMTQATTPRLEKDRHRRSGYGPARVEPRVYGWSDRERLRMDDKKINPGKAPESLAPYPWKFNPGWIAFDEVAELPAKALYDMAAADRDRRLRALEDKVTRLLAWQDKQIATKKPFEGLVASAGYGSSDLVGALKDMRKLNAISRKAVLKPKPPAKRKKR